MATAAVNSAAINHGSFAEIQQGFVPQDIEGFTPGYSVYDGADTFDLIYKRRRQPNLAGAHEFAFETFGLMPSSYIGPATMARAMPTPRIFTPPNVVMNPAVLTYGLPIISGGIYGAPLIDANGNMMDSLAPDISTFQRGWNNPSVWSATPPPLGNPFPQGY